MANVSVAVEWQLLYNRYYRKPEPYPMRWKHIDLSRNKAACAPFGGQIAVIRDDSKIVCDPEVGIPLSIKQYKEVAFLLWKESWELSKNPMASKGSPLHGPRIKLIEKSQGLFSESKEHNFESKAAEEHAKLLRIQHELEVSTKQAIFVDSSISDTIRTCIVLGNHRAAMKVRTEFKVSEKRWYWLKVFSLATIRDWDALEKFSKEKRPPIGYRPFVEACIDADEKGEAVK
ncbi:protein VACUOLELESS1-like [Punica granatum]|uniref:Protein VACUOLELESS1-like n=1 Tax=Punica granatum TaxID=22663 RepID=A0A6P8D7U5_PUNGR|nr:protein VACUOLELESS1-like [Punica granatum]